MRNQASVQIRGIKVVHNGYKIEFMHTMEEVEGYIQSVIRNHLNLDPERIMDKVIHKGKSGCTRLVRYRYRTLYEEDFLIDIEYDT